MVVLFRRAFGFAGMRAVDGCFVYEEMRYLYRIPSLLARLREPGIRQQVYDQWNSVRPEEHHRVAQMWLIDGMNNYLAIAVTMVISCGSLGLAMLAFPQIRPSRIKGK